MQYPLVELATMLVFVISSTRFLSASEAGHRGHADDWRSRGSWLLWAGLIALTVMDLEVYLVEINVTWGILVSACWAMPSGRRPQQRVDPPVRDRPCSLAVTVGLSIGSLLFS